MCGNSEDFLDNSIIVNSFHDIQSLDDFDINVVLLNNAMIWNSQASSYYNVDCIDDIKSIGVLINNCTRCKNIIVYPQNYTFMYSTKDNKPAPAQAPGFCMLLRKPRTNSSDYV